MYFISCALCYVTCMPRGTSGRIVIEVDPQLKHDLYVELARREMTLKSWFIREAGALIAIGAQLTLLPEGNTASGGRRDSGAERK